MTVVLFHSGSVKVDETMYLGIAFLALGEFAVRRDGQAPVEPLVGPAAEQLRLARLQLVECLYFSCSGPWNSKTQPARR